MVGFEVGHAGGRDARGRQGRVSREKRDAHMSVLLGDEFAYVLSAAQAGEEWAVARLYRSLQPALLRYLNAREPQDAEDIAAQVWLEVARALTKFEGGEEGFRAYVFTIARRRMLNAKRGRARRRVRGAGGIAGRGPGEGARPGRPPAEGTRRMTPVGAADGPVGV